MATSPSISITILTIFFFFLIATSLWPSIAASETACTSKVCYRNEPVIRFPFRIPTRQANPSCGFRGFDVSCSSSTMNMTLLNLPGSGQFMVQAIDYGEQELWLNDPDTCLPRRILSLNLSGSPFTAVHLQKFSFFNCSSSNYTTFSLDPIACLSGTSYAVFATSSHKVVGELSQSCRFMASVPVPVQRPFYEEVLSSDLSDDLHLTWEAPRCGPCESSGGRCGLKANSSSEIECRNIPRQGLPRAVHYAITVGVGVPGFLLVIGLLNCIYGKVKSYTVNERNQIIEVSSSNPHDSVVISGLDEPTIDSYPKIVLGESRRLLKADDVTCSICLVEYQPRDTLKTIPQCNHCFHANCIDQWLRLNETCPICRNSPQRLSKVGNDV